MTALDDLALQPFHDADAPQRARMLSRLADTELSVALKGEPEGDQIELRMFPLDGAEAALACDGEDRLAEFFGEPVAYAAMPGRVLAGLLGPEGAGLLVNPGHPSEMFLDATILQWLSGALAAVPEKAEAHLRLTAPQAETVEALAEPLAARLVDMHGLITGAALAAVEGPERSHVLLIAGADEDHQPAIAKALSEALAFLPPQPGGVDISFTGKQPPAAALRFDIPEPATNSPQPKKNSPPRLR